MKSAAEVFFLVVFSLLKISQCADQNGASKIQIPGTDICEASSTKAIISDACTSFLTLDKLNSEIRETLEYITHKTDFFSYYRLNLFGKECPFWSDHSGVCGNIACAVNTLDNEEQIPLVWRAEELGKLQGPTAAHPTKLSQEVKGLDTPLGGLLGPNVGESCVIEYDESDERDYCIPEDESSGSRGDYVSLVDNPERFTGYAGEGARHIWDAIYRENCFSRPGFADFQLRSAAELGSVFRRYGQEPHEGHRSQVSGGPTRYGSGFELEDECLEKRVFYRIVSGMHTSISAHICSEYLNQTTGTWGPNLRCFKERLQEHPDRISNLYFNYAVVIRAVVKLGPYLKQYTFCSNDATQDFITKSKVQSLIATVAAAPRVFDESLMFVKGEGPRLKEDFRNRFRNISRIMDCVGCDKCRLWGKLQTAGYGTALKVLFESKDNIFDIPKLKRTEIVALFNTLARISSSMESIKNFKNMIEKEKTYQAKKGRNHQHSTSDWVGESPNVIPERSLNEIEGDEFEEDQEKFRTYQRHLNSTFKEKLYTELDIFYKVTKYVVRSWIDFPTKLWQILKIEIPRAWDSYIGLPVKPRTWVFRRPDVDEL